MKKFSKYEEDLLIAHSIFGEAYFDAYDEVGDEIAVVALINLAKGVLEASEKLYCFERIESELFDLRSELALRTGDRRLN